MDLWEAAKGVDLGNSFLWLKQFRQFVGLQSDVPRVVLEAHQICRKLTRL